MDEETYLKRLRELWRKNWPAVVRAENHYPFGERPICDYVRERARTNPDKVAYIFYGAQLTFGELDRQSERLAALLRAHGIVKGDRVAVFLPNIPQFIVSFHAILKAGGIHVPVNPMLKAEELVHVLTDTRARVLITLDQFMPLVREVRDRVHVKTVFTTSYADAFPAAATVRIPDSISLAAAQISSDAIDLLTALRDSSLDNARVTVDVALDDIAALNYTSGTTGLPKGCIHTHANLIYTCAKGRLAASEPADERSISLYYQQMFWIAGETVILLLPVFMGATCVVMARWDPLAFLQLIERYRVTRTSLLVDHVIELMDRGDFTGFNLSSLSTVLVNSFVKKLNVDVRARWRKLTGTTLLEGGWGMTETHSLDTVLTGLQQDDFDLKSQPVFVGVPVRGTEFKICDFDSGALQPLDEQGEIHVRSPSLFKGYWNSPEASVRAFRNGWFPTGDIGVLDPQGYLHFLGRRKEMLKVKGISVAPTEIEALLAKHPAVAAAAVIGRPDAVRGQCPVAFVRLEQFVEPLPDAEQLVAWCKTAMAAYKVPEIRIVESFPMTATGKIRKDALLGLLPSA